MTATKTLIAPVLHHSSSAATVNSKRKFFSERFQSSTLLVDILLLNISLLSGIAFSLGDITIFSGQGTTWFLFLLIANVSWLITATYSDIYKWYEILRPYKKVQTLLYVNTIFFSVLSSLYYYLFSSLLTINFLLPALLLYIFSSIASHLIFRAYYQKQMPVFNYIIVGGEKEHIEHIQELYGNACKGRSKCIGVFSNTAIKPVNWLGNFQDIKRFTFKYSFDKLFYINSDLQKKDVHNIMKLCDNRLIDFEIVPREFYMIDGGARIINEGKLPVLAPHIEALQRPRNKFLKRAFDVIFSLVVILFIFPIVFPIIALLIKLESPGPIFFFQERTGYWNSAFKFIKFRSMCVNKDADSKQASRSDLRVTKFGSFLRKTSLDELPQFFNVLKGDMSVVGPRPHMLQHTEEYSALIETYMIRHKVKPGITGWAQINGYRGPTETLEKMEKRVEFDVHYMKNWTLLMDIRCVLYTVINMITGEENAV